MGIWRKRTARSVIRDEDRRERDRKLFQKLRAATHELQRVELRDLTPFVDELVAKIRKDLIDTGKVSGARLRFHDKLQAVVPSEAFKGALYPIIRRQIPEATGNCFTVYWDDQAGYSLGISFPEPILYRDGAEHHLSAKHAS